MYNWLWPVVVFLDLFLQFEPPLYILFKILLSRCTWLLCLMSIVSCSLSVGQVVLSIQKGAHLLTVFRQSRGICNDWSSSIAFLAAIFFNKPSWFWTQYFWSPFFFLSCAGYHFKEGLWTNLYYLLSTGVYSQWLLFFWLTLFFRHLQRELQSSLPNSDYCFTTLKKSRDLWVEMSPGHQN